MSQSVAVEHKIFRQLLMFPYITEWKDAFMTVLKVMASSSTEILRTGSIYL